MHVRQFIEGLRGTASASAPRRRRSRSVSLWEFVGQSSPRRVDRKAGVIRDVKVLGLESLNGRRYLPEAVRKARPLYEGASVRLNHTGKPGESYDVKDVFGWLEGVYVGTDGCLYGNLHITNPKTDFAETVFCAAEKNPRQFGLSHNAQGESEVGKDGVEVIWEIVEVRSVDLVADPATTRGLFESRGQRSRSGSQTMKPGTRRGRKLLTNPRAFIEALRYGVEAADHIDGDEMEDDDIAAIAGSALAQIRSILDETNGDDGNDEDTLRRIISICDHANIGPGNENDSDDDGQGASAEGRRRKR